MGAGGDFVIEGDEYDSAFFDKTAKFLKYLPDIAVINNIEFDHADIYADLDEVRLAFRRLANLVPRNGLLLLGPTVRDAAALAGPSARETFGLDDGADWQAHDLSRARRRHAFRRPAAGRDVRTRSSRRCSARTTCVMRSPRLPSARSGPDWRTLAGAAGVQGIKRRLEIVGVARGVTVLDDFAHHPTAVYETLAALRIGYPDRRIWAVFEPRSASSCRRVFQDAFAAGSAPPTRSWSPRCSDRRCRRRSGWMPIDSSPIFAAGGHGRGTSRRSTTSSPPSSVSTGTATWSC